MSNSKLSLPIDPYLFNSTTWWIENYLNSLIDMDISHDEQYIAYQNWMKRQGVIIKDPRTHRQKIESCGSIDFTDEEHMLLFILKWG